MLVKSVVDPRGGNGDQGHPPCTLKNSHKKMAVKRGSLYFMFRGRHPFEMKPARSVIHSICFATCLYTVIPQLSFIDVAFAFTQLSVNRSSYMCVGVEEVGG